MLAFASPTPALRRRAPRTTSCGGSRRSSSSPACRCGSAREAAGPLRRATRSTRTTRPSTTSSGVFHVVTVGAWLFVAVRLDGTRRSSRASHSWSLFWALALVLVPVARGLARALSGAASRTCRTRSSSAPATSASSSRGSCSSTPSTASTSSASSTPSRRSAASDLGHSALLGPPTSCRRSSSVLDVERVIVAFSNEPHDAARCELIRSLRDSDVQIDVVPRLFELVGPRVGDPHRRGPAARRPPARAALPPSSRLLKRAIDLVGASLLARVTAPLFAFIAVARSSATRPGPSSSARQRLGHEHARVHGRSSSGP